MTIVGRLRGCPFILRADAARDRGDWAVAAGYYRQALKLAPDHAGAWVQLGNVLKENLDYSEAEAAYARAFALRPRSADVHLQQGHLHKLRGSLGDAAASYARALALGGKATEAASELQRLGHSVDGETSKAGSERSAALSRGQHADVEARLNALSGQMTTFLEHVSTTKALAFEVAKCRAALEKLGASVDETANHSPTAQENIVSGLASRIRSLADRLSALETTVSDTAQRRETSMVSRGPVGGDASQA